MIPIDVQINTKTFKVLKTLKVERSATSLLNSIYLNIYRFLKPVRSLGQNVYLKSHSSSQFMPVPTIAYATMLSLKPPQKYLGWDNQIAAR
jgi:hypothetical protein